MRNIWRFPFGVYIKVLDFLKLSLFGVSNSTFELFLNTSLARLQVEGLLRRSPLWALHMSHTYAYTNTYTHIYIYVSNM